MCKIIDSVTDNEKIKWDFFLSYASKICTFNLQHYKVFATLGRSDVKSE